MMLPESEPDFFRLPLCKGSIDFLPPVAGVCRERVAETSDVHSAGAGFLSRLQIAGNWIG